MSNFNLLPGASGGNLPVRPPRRTRRFALACEPLETRQLLSTSFFPAAIASGEAPQLITVQPSLSLMPSSTSGSPTGLSPSQVRTAYGVNQIAFNGNVVGNGAGQTIAIVDAYYDPNIQSDLQYVRRPVRLGRATVVHAIRRVGAPDRERELGLMRSMSNGRTRSRPREYRPGRSAISPTFSGVSFAASCRASRWYR